MPKSSMDDAKIPLTLLPSSRAKGQLYLYPVEIPRKVHFTCYALTKG